jgi:hypothetical protein
LGITFVPIVQQPIDSVQLQNHLQQIKESIQVFCSFAQKVTILSRNPERVVQLV